MSGVLIWTVALVELGGVEVEDLFEIQGTLSLSQLLDIDSVLETEFRQ